MSDVTVYRKPSFYFYEYVEETNENVVSYAYKYESFDECANSYDAEIDAINAMLTSTKDANISGELTNDNLGKKVFESLLTNINNSNIFRDIYSELVSKIFSNIYYRYSGVDYSLDKFILYNSMDQISSIPEGTDIVLEEIKAIENNFALEINGEYQANNTLYQIEGNSLDLFIDHVVSLNGKPEVPAEVSNQFIGQIMTNNFDTFLLELLG